MFPIFTLIMDNGHEIKIELRSDVAENGVNGIIEAVYEHAYDNLAIQRIVPGFVLQPWYDEARMGPFYQYVSDLEDSGLPFVKYSVGLAGDGSRISAPSCPFIVVGDQWQERLNGKFTNIGQVIAGFEEVERIMNVQLVLIENDQATVYEPKEPEVIKTATIELNGYEYKGCKKYLIEA